MELKRYQQKALDEISEFLTFLNRFQPDFAYMHAVKHTMEKDGMIPAYKDQYFGENVPFICIKIPTGGGKTFVACHATGQIMQSFLKEKLGRGIVMWFVPSEAIKSQTLRKFKDRKDIHRKALDELFDNNVKIFSNEEALRIRKEDVENNLCIIISSLDAFRKEKKLQNKYKVYQENGALLNHFDDVVESETLEKDDSGIITSLANVIRLSNPLIVIDEGHKTKTELSVTFLKELNPSFVIEYTATPRKESNVLVDIRSSELKEEEMVKLPLVLESHTQWQAAVLQGAIRREDLETMAKKAKEQIRPIALLQAVQEKESENKVTVEKIKEFLIKERKIPEDEIAVKTSKTDDLKGVDLFAKSCKIRYIITVNALAEGWDCSFAYILISVANIGSKIAVEQIIGRIMRMPFAKKKSVEDLNRSYVFASARNFNEAATQIISGLESNGYSKSDILNASNKTHKTELEIERRFNEEFKIPLIGYEKESLAFEDLIDDFVLHKQEAKFEYEALYDSDGRAIIDIKEGDKWTRSAQQILKLTYHDKHCSKSELVHWLDKNLRFKEIYRDDKVEFLEKIIDGILNGKKDCKLSDLSVNRYVLREQLSSLISDLLEAHALKRFNASIKDKKIGLADSDVFPALITLSEELPQEFNRSYYAKIDKLNKEEMRFIERIDLDSLKNIRFWIRNKEKTELFYLQGWRRNKFYPDFIALTEKGNILALEWKGEDRLSNEDTNYKEQLGKVWERLGNGKLHFFLVHNGNVEDVLTKMKSL